MPAIHLSNYQTVNKFIILQSHVFLLSYFCSKKRSIGVVEPRVVVKIPLAPKVRADTGINNTNSNSNSTNTTTGSANNFLQPAADSSSLSHTSEPEGQNNSNTSTSSRKRQNSDGKLFNGLKYFQKKHCNFRYFISKHL